MSERRRLPLRPLLLVAVVVACIVGVRASGVAEGLTLTELQGFVSDFGVAAIPVYWLVFLLAVAMTVPGYPFVVLGVLCFGGVVGVPVALAGAGLSGTLVTSAYRAVGGQPELPRWAVVQKALALVERRPVLGIAALRVIFMISGPANVVLAFAGVRPLHNLLGTVLGLVPATLITALAVDLVVALIGGAG